MPQSPSDHPFHVYAVPGAIHSGHDAEGNATAAASRANDEAKALGIQTRYEVRAS